MADGNFDNSNSAFMRAPKDTIRPLRTGSLDIGGSDKGWVLVTHKKVGDKEFLECWLNVGLLYKNDRKEKDSHPDIKGSLKIDGVEYWASAWKGKDKNDEDYTKLKLTPKDQQGQQGAGSGGGAAEALGDSGGDAIGDDEIPF